MKRLLCLILVFNCIFCAFCGCKDATVIPNDEEPKIESAYDMLKEFISKNGETLDGYSMSKDYTNNGVYNKAIKFQGPVTSKRNANILIGINDTTGRIEMWSISTALVYLRFEENGDIFAKVTVFKEGVYSEPLVKGERVSEQEIFKGENTMNGAVTYGGAYPKYFLFLSMSYIEKVLENEFGHKFSFSDAGFSYTDPEKYAYRLYD